MKTIRVFIQARMSSQRFPGKVLAPFRGQPLIRNVIDRVAHAVPLSQIVVVTSVDPTDDPLSLYIQHLQVACFRGSLEDVFSRFQRALNLYPCEWLIRVSGDSPLMDGEIITTMLDYALHDPNRDQVSLYTNVFPRTFPVGHSVEIIHAQRFAAISADTLTADEKEHVTKVFYNHPAQYGIINRESGDPSLAQKRLVVDTLDDLRRLEQES